MIRSYTSEIGKDLFEGNWSVFPNQHALEPLEDCFIDLRVLDAAATRDDIERAFRDRLVTHGESGKWTYSIVQPDTCAFGYRIDFTWAGNNVESVNVVISPRTEDQ